ncbi:MAG: imidazole glycerol phosphate synthase subunit HisH [Acetivibrionales bacterium]|jgi:glutamine amidotransferase
MIAIIDYDAGNLKNVENAFKKMGAVSLITCDEATILKSEAVVLPGVGAFADCMESLVNKGMDRVVKACIDMGKPFLGICLGFQMLFEYSEEHPEGFPDTKGLGILKGGVKKFPTGTGLKIPHMGWNNLSFHKPCPLFKNLPRDIFIDSDDISSVPDNKRNQGAYLYFVHSYYVEASDKSIVSATAQYGISFDAAISWKNVYGTQFHPEKSGKAGMAIIDNFLKVVHRI